MHWCNMLRSKLIPNCSCNCTLAWYTSLKPMVSVYLCTASVRSCYKFKQTSSKLRSKEVYINIFMGTWQKAKIWIFITLYQIDCINRWKMNIYHFFSQFWKPVMRSFKVKCRKWNIFIHTQNKSSIHDVISSKISVLCILWKTSHWFLKFHMK